MKLLKRITRMRLISKFLVIAWFIGITLTSVRLGNETTQLGVWPIVCSYIVATLVYLFPVFLIERRNSRDTNTQHHIPQNSSFTETTNIPSSNTPPSSFPFPADRSVDARIQKRRKYFYQKYKVDVRNIETIDFLDGHTFEYFCADLLKINGFCNVEVTRGSGDQGADIIASQNGKKLAIQCKHRNDPYTTRYGNKPIQEVYTGKSFYGCDEGIVLTNGYFTEGGYNAAKVTGVRLWDRETLIKLLRRAGFDQTSTAKTNTKTNANPADEYLNHTNNPNNRSNIICEGIAILLDNSSFSHFGITVKDFGINKDIDEQDSIELLFDIIAMNGRRITADIDIVCNIYANGRKLCTESHTIFSEKFRGRDSATVSFDKKNIYKIADKIEMYCKEW